MADGIRIKVTGDKELRRALESFRPAVQTQIVRKAIRTPGSKLTKAVKAAVPQDLEPLYRVDAKVLRRSIGRRPFTKGRGPGGRYVGQVVGPRKGFPFTYTAIGRKPDGSYGTVTRTEEAHRSAHRVEKGCIVRETPASGSTVHMPPRPFLRPVYDANKDSLIREVIGNLRPLIAEQLKRGRR